jgi:ABC-2 type transport system permease protein
LEGKNFALLKSLPIKPVVLLGSKIVFNLVLLIPVIIFTVMGFGYSFSLSGLEMFMLGLLLITLALMMSLFFMWVNLWFPRFDFQTEVEVVKQSIAPLIAVFGAIFLVVMSGFFVFEILKDQSWFTSSLIVLVMNITLIIIFSTTLLTAGLKIYHQLEN